MTDADLEQFGFAINALAAVFRIELSEAMLHGYWLGLRDLDLSALKIAIEEAIRTSQYMPTPSGLREAVEGKASDRAIIAFGRVEEAVRQLGYRRSVTFGDDSCINAAIRACGGWQYICGLPTHEFDSFFRRDFLKSYEAFCRSGVSEEASAPLLGVVDQENGRDGYGQREPICLISRPVMRSGIQRAPRPRKPEPPRIAATPTRQDHVPVQFRKP